MSADHFSLIVPLDKVDPIVTFLVESLKPVTFKEYYRPVPHAVGMGLEGDRPDFWVAGRDFTDCDQKGLQQLWKASHYAFKAESNEAVDQCYAAAMKAGAIDNGPPGPRDYYHPGYYGGFFRDPYCGINWEVVCHNGGSRTK